MKIGFIGVGAMGGPMSRNIVGKTNHEVTVFDLNPAAMEACIKAGAKRGESVAEVAAASEVIMLSLPTPKHVEAVIAGPDGIAENAKPGTVVIDLSTNSPGVIKRLGDLLSTKSIALIEAPVTGGVVKALDGTLTIIAGGDEAVIDKQRPLLSSIGALVVHTGPHGSASVAKIVNNMLALCNSAVAAEGMMMAKMSGVDLNKIVEVISNGSGNSKAFRGVTARAAAGQVRAELRARSRLQGPQPRRRPRHRARRPRHGRAAGAEPDASRARHGFWPGRLDLDDQGLRERARQAGEVEVGATSQPVIPRSRA